MAKKKPAPDVEKAPAEKAPAEKAVIYIEVEPSIKDRLVRLGALPHRRRKITAEATIAILRYLDDEEAKEGLDPIEVQE